MPKIVGSAIGLLLAFFLLPAPASAWNAFGHRAVAKIAYMETSTNRPAAVKAIFELLKNHPHFGTEFDIFTKDRPDGVSEAEWAIVQAATWPDFVRPPKFPPLSDEQIKAHPRFKYHRKFDHFSDIALADPAFTAKIVPANSGTLLDALANAEKALNDPKTPLPDKAIAFCWLAHLCGDIHQPLHCTSFFSKDFPKGDGGGNLFLIGNTNLHTFWDDVLGSASSSFHNLEAVSSDIHRAGQLQRDKMIELKQNLTYESWAKESHDVAVNVAYKDGDKMLQGASQAHSHDDGPLSIPAFPADYRAEAKVSAQRRVALAGYRLADKIDAIFK